MRRHGNRRRGRCAHASAAEIRRLALGLPVLTRTENVSGEMTPEMARVQEVSVYRPAGPSDLTARSSALSC